MKDGFRQSMAMLHSWAGLLPGWLLFVIFLFGTTAFFQNEINAWMRPELSQARVTPHALDAAGRLLETRGRDAESWSLSLPGPRGGEGIAISWTPKDGKRGDAREVTLDPATGGELVVRDTKGGYFLYRFHFDLHYMPVAWARYIVSIVALAMLVAILSGVVTHKKIFVDFFLLRLGKGQRSWLDAHNVTGVIALPFFMMITYTGLVTLLFTLMPWAVSANFPSQDAFYETLYPQPDMAGARTDPAPMIPLSRLAGIAGQQWGGVLPFYIAVDRPGTVSAVATLYPARERWGDPSNILHLNMATGKPVPVAAGGGAASATQDVMVDLHRGWFARPLLRWFYFLSGVGGTIMVATGLVLWTVKRRAKLPDPARPHFGFRLVERLNIGVIVGAPIGIAVYFLANRLLPPGLPHRADWEINALFIGWGATFVWAIARPARRAWVETLRACALVHALVPPVNAILTTRGPWNSILAGDGIFVGFDAVMLAVAGLCLLAAHRVASHKARAAPRRRAQVAAEAGA